jgi:superfamily II DNA or RNA helicase
MSKKGSKKIYSYPQPEDPNLQSKIFSKREFYYYKVPQREKFKTYEEIQNFREEMCPSNPLEFQPREQQAILPNFLNPDTPYKGVLLVHGVGSGKTISGILMAEQFKEQAKRYGQKIMILVPGTSIRETWKNDLLKGTRETYLKDKEILNQMSKVDQERQRRIAINQAQQYYRIMSYMTFYKKVLGEKIAEKKLVGEEVVKTSYKRDESGEIEREQVVDRITNLDNTLLIADEAHNLTGNEYGLALMKIKERSKNLRIILLSGTPMKNLADDIIDMLNFVRPNDKPILREKVFTGEKNYMMKFKEGGEEYLRKMATGYISYYRGSAPYTFAKKVSKGEVIDGLLFTHVVQCYMEKFQLETYKIATKEFDDALDRASSAAANFVFPALDKDRKKLIGVYSTEGISRVLNQLVSDKKTIIDLVNKQIFNQKINKDDLSEFIKEGEMKNIIGNLYQLEYLKHFSIKFYKCIERLNKLNELEKNPGTAFIYSNLTKAGGIEVFAECLKANGYLEYKENPNEYIIEDDTRDALTGLTLVEFKKKFRNREFKPATFIIVTGGSDDGIVDEDQEEKQRIIREVFNNVDNIYGEKIKLVLGSRVMTEGVNLANIKEIHILDVHYNLGKVDQVIGRGVRMCQHKDSITETNKFPEVNIYRYVVSLKGEMSSDEKLYQKGELKYLLVKRVERILKEIAIDCPLLHHANQFPEELEEFKDCYPVNEENKRKGLKLCPALCDFESCESKCWDPKLKFDNKKKTYLELEDKEIDYGTFNKNLAGTEIQLIKDKIRDLYRFKSVYTYEEILDKIKQTLSKHQANLFEDKYFNMALDEMMPRDENDFNSFTSTVYDRFGRNGYLIQRENYYIFQPFNQDEDAPMFYRNNLEIDIENPVPVKNYIKDKFGDKITLVKQDEGRNDKKKKSSGYDFESVMSYYDNRDEHTIVGIIEQNRNIEENDIFKIRNQRPKVLDKKRGTGIPSLKGAVCSTSKDRDFLIKIINKLPGLETLKNLQDKNRDYLCDIIQNKLMFMEKYSTSKEGNKKTYVMIPNDHPKYPFPYNLEDRIKEIINSIQKTSGIQLDYQVKKENNGIFLNQRDKNFVRYLLTFKNSKSLDASLSNIRKYKGELKGNIWTIVIE